MLSPFRMVCGNFILPEPASYVFFYAFSNLRNLLYIIDEIEMRLAYTDELEHLSKVWPKLDGRSRYLLESHYILEKSPYEIAANLGIKADSVRMALTRARKAAYALLAKE